jgi:hypothetical protein
MKLRFGLCLSLTFAGRRSTMGPTTEDEMIDPFDNDEKKARDTAKILELKRQGKSDWEIADSLNISFNTVRNRLKEAFAQMRQVAVEEHYAIELTRLEWLRSKAEKILEAYEDDDPELALKAFDRVMKTHDAKAKLTGIGAPDRSEVNVTGENLSSVLTDRLAKVTADLDKKRSARRAKN